MRRTEVLQGIREMRFEALLDRHERGELSQIEAAEMLGITERTFRRWRDRHDEEGPAGLRDRRLGKPSSRRAAAAEIARMLGLYEERYTDFTVKHFHEQMVKRHDYKLGYTVTRLNLQAAGLVRKAPRRGAHRKKRVRRPMAGMMLHQDASTHAWLCGRAPLDLVVTMDDATSTIYSAIFVEEEGTMSSFSGLIETIAANGLFCSFYTDRGSHYFYTPEAGGKVSKDTLTQVGRALAQLGIEHIAAYSPEARGRSERMFRTLQDRLPKELRLSGIIDDVEAANRFLRKVYVPAHNARFSVAPSETGSAFVPVDRAQWRDILCVQDERTVAPDNTVAWNGRRLQIPEHPARAHFVRAKVRVHEYPDGELAIFHGPRCLTRWRAGEPTLETTIPSAASPAFAPEPACGRRGRAALAHSAHRTTATKAVNSCAT